MQSLFTTILANVTLLNEVEGNGVDDSSAREAKMNIEVSVKDQKHSVKNEDKQEHKKTSVEKTLEFLYSNVLKCQSSFVATVLQSLCNLSNDPSCESILRLHTVRLVLSLCEYAPSEMLRKEIIEHESEDEQRRRNPTNTKTDLSNEQKLLVRWTITIALVLCWSCSMPVRKKLVPF